MRLKYARMLLLTTEEPVSEITKKYIQAEKPTVSGYATCAGPKSKKK